MKTIIFLMLMVNMIWAQTELDMADCEREAYDFGNGKGADFITPKCMNIFGTMAEATVKMSEDQMLRSSGFRNLVWVDRRIGDRFERFLIAGGSTDLKDVIAVAVDSKNNEVAVLQRSGDILFFSSLITGNVAPLRTLRTPELEGASDIVVDPDSNQIMVLNPKSSSLLFYSRLANFYGREGKKDLGLKRIIEKVQGQGLQLDSAKKELRLLQGKSPIGTIPLNKKKDS